MFSGLKSLCLSWVNKAVSSSRPLSVLSSRRLTDLESWTHDVQQHTSGFYFVDDLSFSRLASLFCTLPTREVDAYDFRKTFNMNKNKFGEFWVYGDWKVTGRNGRGGLTLNFGTCLSQI